MAEAVQDRFMMRGEFNLSEVDALRVSEAQPAPVLTTAPTPSDDSPDFPQPVLTQRWTWLRLGFTACCVLGGVAGAAILWMLSLPPAPNCQQITPLTPDMERLYCAQEAVRSGELPKLVAGIKLLEAWTPDHPLYGEAQRRMVEWSDSVLVLARQKWYQSDLKGAVDIASRIPKSSPVYVTAQAEISGWKQQWQRGERIFSEAQKALKTQDWDRASERILALRELEYDYWRSQQANLLSRQLIDEQRGRQLFGQAQKIARSGQPQHLSAAITLTSRIQLNTYAWLDAQSNLQRWSEVLLTVGLQHWHQGRLDQTIALAQRVGLNPQLAAEAENLLWLSHARKLELGSASQWKATPSQFLQLLGALVIVEQIAPGSRFYSHAQVVLKTVRAQLQDVSRLQVAQLAAHVQHPTSLKFAVTQAQQVNRDRPRRLQAQTLAAHWTHEIQRIEDRPYLVTARQLAEQATPRSLRQAMAEASRIAKGRVLYREAQGLRVLWKHQLETLEDQPLLNRAQFLAAQGNLGEAINLAAVVRPGRALYWQAQAAIGAWEAEIRQTWLTQIPAPPKPPASASRRPSAKPPQGLETPPNSTTRIEQSSESPTLPLESGERLQPFESPLPPAPTPILPEPAPPPLSEPAPPEVTPLPEPGESSSRLNGELVPSSAVP